MVSYISVKHLSTRTALASSLLLYLPVLPGSRVSSQRTFPQAHVSPDRALEGPCRASAASNGIPPASLSRPACHPTGQPPSRHTRGRSLSRCRGEAADFRDHFPLALGAPPSRAGQYTRTEVFRRLRSGSEHAGGTAGLAPGRAGSPTAAVTSHAHLRDPGPGAPPTPGRPRGTDGAGRGTNCHGAWRVAEQRQSDR